jgi:hypothetical protein
MRTMGDEQGEEKRTRTAFPKKKKKILTTVYQTGMQR